MKKNVQFQRNRPNAHQVFAQIRNKVVAAFKKSAQEHITLRDKATTGWSPANKPIVTLEWFKGYGFIGYRVKVEATIARGSKEKLTVYQLLNDGTSVRKAALEKGFEPKTRPNKLGKFGKGGKAIAVRRRYHFPRIAARNFEETIRQIIEPDTEIIITKAFLDAFNNQ